MAVTFLVLSVISVAAAQLGLPCMQPDTIRKEVGKCFSPLGDTVNLDPTDKSGPMGQVTKLLDKYTCQQQEDTVSAINCYFDFMGNCLNARPLFASKATIADAVAYACQHQREMENPCLDTLKTDMMTCYMKKVQQRQMDIISGKAHAKSVEKEGCGFLKEMLNCMEDNKDDCPDQDSYLADYRFMQRLMPRICHLQGLYDTLKHRPDIGDLMPYQQIDKARFGRP